MPRSRFFPSLRHNVVRVFSRSREEAEEKPINQSTNETFEPCVTLHDFREGWDIRTKWISSNQEVLTKRCQKIQETLQGTTSLAIFNKWIRDLLRQAQDQTATSDTLFPRWIYVEWENYSIILKAVNETWTESRVQRLLQSTILLSTEPIPTPEEVLRNASLLSPKKSLMKKRNSFVERIEKTSKDRRVVEQWSKRLLRSLKAKYKNMYSDPDTWLRVAIVIDLILRNFSAVINESGILPQLAVPQVIETIHYLRDHQ